jgi:hypothetical protein
VGCFLQEVGELPDQALWRFLLGNTLLRMLGHLRVSLAGPAAWWRAAAAGMPDASLAAGEQIEQAAAHARALPAGQLSREEPAAASWPGGEIADAAAELAVVMLCELAARQSPCMTRALIREWARRRSGAVKMDLEQLHARAAGLCIDGP